MGIRDALSSLLGHRKEDTHRIEWMGSAFREMVLGLTPEELYRTQPHLRTVLSFVARNVAHLGLQAFERLSDTDRQRMVGSPLAQLLTRPNPSQTRYELIEQLVSDLGLYDRAYWLVAESRTAPSGWTIQPIPPSWVVKQSGGSEFAAGSFTIESPSGQRSEIDAENMIVFHGWNPGRPKHGTAPVETLKQILAEQVQAWSYRQQIWQRGGRVGAVITRPQGADWSDAARTRFATDWRSAWTGKDGPKAGGTPILEDGMTISRLGFSAREDEWAEVSKVALSTVAGVYHVNPVMVGILDNANFSNTKEFRKMLYSETLGPLLAMIEDRLNTFLVPRIVGADSSAYVEFNIAEKLQGDFEEQAQILSTSTGAPWMTRNEARARQNLPSVVGGDELVVPLNVLTGGQASPRDSGSQNERAAATHHKEARAGVKQHAPSTYAQKAEEVIQAFFRRQANTVLSSLGAKAKGDWWDEQRWNDELANDLLALGLSTTRMIATNVLTSVGLSADDYDVAQTEAFLRSVAESRAGAINSTTRDQISTILAGTGPEGVNSPAHVFEVAAESRSALIATTLVTTFAAFATVEAGKQNGGARKTWIVTSGNPRPEHASMNGETVLIDSTFSNGANWPGDPVLGADGVAGCTCDVEVTFG